jgi:hypothetical protein
MITDVMTPTFPISHPRIANFREIVVKNRNGNVDGYHIDIQTATLICQTYDRINQIDLRNQLMDLCVPALICTCWRLT